MKVVIRSDASLQIGTGHIMRCLTLADALREKQVEVIFVSRNHKGNLNSLIEQKGYKLFCIKNARRKQVACELGEGDGNAECYAEWLGVSWQEDLEQTKSVLKGINPDWLIVDHYAIDSRWEEGLKPFFKKLMVIDDLANRKHVCDLLLDQTFGRSGNDYVNLVPENTKLLIGSLYALLRPEFFEWRDYSLGRRSKPVFEKLLINMGGVDNNNVTSIVLDALKGCDLPKDLLIEIVMGANAPWLKEVECKSMELPFETKIYTNVINMAELMANTDLAIGAAGATTWERCCLGVPSLMIVIAENQKLAAYLLDKSLAAISTSLIDGLKQEIKFRLECLGENTELLRHLSTRASKVTNGLGAERVLLALELNKKRGGR